jgi:predicted transcriptional regulator
MNLYNVYKAIIEYQPENTLGKPIQMRADVVLVADAQAALAEKDKRITEIEENNKFLMGYRDNLIERIKELEAELSKAREIIVRPRGIS